MQYDPTIAPEDDPNGWPTMEACGDCSSCTAVSQSTLKKDLKIVFIMRAVWLASLAVGSVQLLRAWIMDRITPSPQQSTVSNAGLLPNRSQREWNVDGPTRCHSRLEKSVKAVG